MERRGIYPDTNLMAVSILVVIAGGFLGSSLGSRLFPARVVKYTLVAVLLFASFKLLMT